MIKANSLKNEDAKLKGLKSVDYVSQLPINHLPMQIDRLIGFRLVYFLLLFHHHFQKGDWSLWN
jgi:hypothetical protein